MMQITSENCQEKRADEFAADENFSLRAKLPHADITESPLG